MYVGGVSDGVECREGRMPRRHGIGEMRMVLTVTAEIRHGLWKTI